MNEQELFIRWARFRYGLTDSGTALIRAQLRLENGRKGSEAGFNPIKVQGVYSGDVQAYADPTMPDGAEQHCRLARKITRHLMNWVLLDPKRRAEWMEIYAADYLCGSTSGDKKRNNYEYFRLLQRLFNEEKCKITTCKYNPITGTTGWAE